MENRVCRDNYGVVCIAVKLFYGYFERVVYGS